MGLYFWDCLSLPAVYPGWLLSFCFFFFPPPELFVFFLSPLPPYLIACLLSCLACMGKFWQNELYFTHKVAVGHWHSRPVLAEHHHLPRQHEPTHTFWLAGQSQKGHSFAPTPQRVTVSALALAVSYRIHSCSLLPCLQTSIPCLPFYHSSRANVNQHFCDVFVRRT